MPAAVKTVLIVEDNDDLRQLFGTALTFAGFHVQEAVDGLDALRRIRTEPPDLVVLDIGLPFVDGLVVGQQLAGQALSCNIPVVVVTGMPGPHEELPRVHLLRKPVSPVQLVETVRACLAEGRN